jgi:Glu-tRNA(Gln) amidotransferase subunit E-like FAD-binding protein
VEHIRDGLPEAPWAREARYAAAGVPREWLAGLTLAPRARLLDRVVALGCDARTAAALLVERMRAWRRRGLPLARLDDDATAGVFAAHAAGRLAREGIEPVLGWLAAHGASDVEAATAALGMMPLAPALARAEVAAAVAAFDARAMRRPEKAHDHLMGALMARLRGRVPGREVAAMLRAALAAKGADGAPRREVRRGS